MLKAFAFESQVVGPWRVCPILDYGDLLVVITILEEIKLFFPPFQDLIFDSPTIASILFWTTIISIPSI